MKRIIVSIVLLAVMLVSITSCGAGKQVASEAQGNSNTSSSVIDVIATPATAPETTPPPETVAEDIGEYVVDISKVAQNSYALFGTINVNNYRLGVTVDRGIEGYQPFYIVSRIGKAEEVKLITTFAGETITDIPIKKLLHAGDLSSVIGIDSDLSTDKLVVIGYIAATNSLTIAGFTENSTRRAVITYVPDAVYRVTLDNDKNEGNALVQYFSLERERITVAPDSWEPIHYSFMIPEGTVVPEDFTVWVYTEATYVVGTGSGVESIIGYYAPIHVTMNK